MISARAWRARGISWPLFSILPVKRNATIDIEAAMSECRQLVVVFAVRDVSLFGRRLPTFATSRCRLKEPSAMRPN
jgi:hypothetical protein